LKEFVHLLVLILKTGKEFLMYAKRLNQNDQIRIIAQIRALSELLKE